MRLPCGPEAAEILARRRRSGVPDPVGRKVAAKSRGDTVARDLVVDIQGIAVERRDLRLARRARGCGFGIDDPLDRRKHARSEEHTSELQSLMRISYAVFCLKKKTTQ